MKNERGHTTLVGILIAIVLALGLVPTVTAEVLGLPMSEKVPWYLLTLVLTLTVGCIALYSRRQDK